MHKQENRSKKKLRWQNSEKKFEKTGEMQTGATSTRQPELRSVLHHQTAVGAAEVSHSTNKHVDEDCVMESVPRAKKEKRICSEYVTTRKN